MKNIKIRINVLGKADELTKELIKDFFRYCVFDCTIEENEQQANSTQQNLVNIEYELDITDKENIKHIKSELENIIKMLGKSEKLLFKLDINKIKPMNRQKIAKQFMADIGKSSSNLQQTEDDRFEITVNAEDIDIQDNYGIENQRRVLENVFRKIKEIETPYTQKSMRELMDIYLEYDLFRQGKIIEWYGHERSMANINKIAQAQNKINSVSQNKDNTQKELFKYANILCGCKRRQFEDNKIEELEELFKDALPTDIIQIAIGDMWLLKNDNKKALNYYRGFKKYNENIDNEVDAYLYRTEANILASYPLEGEWVNEIIDLYDKSNSIKPYYKTYFKLYYIYNAIQDYKISASYAREGIKELEQKAQMQNLNPKEIDFYRGFMNCITLLWMGLEENDKIIETGAKAKLFKKQYIDENDFFEKFFTDEAENYRKKSKGICRIQGWFERISFACEAKIGQGVGVEERKKLQEMVEEYRILADKGQVNTTKLLV